MVLYWAGAVHNVTVLLSTVSLIQPSLQKEQTKETWQYDEITKLPGFSLTMECFSPGALYISISLDFDKSKLDGSQ